MPLSAMRHDYRCNFQGSSSLYHPAHWIQCAVDGDIPAEHQ